MPLNLTDLEVRDIITPDGKAWMFGAHGDTVTVHFAPEEGARLGVNKCYRAEECDEIADS